MNVIPAVGVKPAVNVTMVATPGGSVLYAELVIPPEALASLFDRPDLRHHNLYILASAVHARLQRFVIEAEQDYRNRGGV
jgi:hypothetical protein